MLIYGAGGHARVVCGIIEESNHKIQGIFDDFSKLSTLDNYKILGKYSTRKFPEDELIIAIGDNKLRRIISDSITHNFGKAIHPNAIIDKIVDIDEGTVVMANVLINRGTVIAKHCIINSCASIDHDCQINDFVHVAPNSTICGGVVIDQGTLVGAGATVIQNIQIGKNVIIGAGTVVIENIPDNAIVVGSPGKIIKFINE